MRLIDLSINNLEFNNFVMAIKALLDTENSYVLLIKIKNFKDSQLIAKYIASLAITDKIEAKTSSSNSIIELAINELLINSIEHGMLGINYSLKSELLQNNIWDQYVHNVLLTLSADQVVKIFFQTTKIANQVLIKIEDPGKGFKQEQIAQLQAKSAKIDRHGRGRLLIQLGLPDLVYHGSGNVATFVINCDPKVLSDLQI